MKKLWKILCLIFGAFSLFSPFVSCDNASTVPTDDEKNTSKYKTDSSLAEPEQGYMRINFLGKNAYDCYIFYDGWDKDELAKSSDWNKDCLLVNKKNGDFRYVDVKMADSPSSVAFIIRDKNKAKLSSDNDVIFTFPNKCNQIYLKEKSNVCYVKPDLETLAPGLYSVEIIDSNTLSLNVNSVTPTMENLSVNYGEKKLTVISISGTNVTVVEDFKENPGATVSLKDNEGYTDVRSASVTGKLIDEWFSVSESVFSSFGYKNGVFTTWAPLASSAKVLLFTDSSAVEKKTSAKEIEMTKQVDGTWKTDDVSADVGTNKYYKYKFVQPESTYETCDIWGKVASKNSEASQIIDINDSSLVVESNYVNPFGKNGTETKNYTEAIIYEMHIRDWSRAYVKDSTGTFEDITSSLGENGAGEFALHLKDLGITHVQILPMFEYAPADNNDKDYNWGYNPYNWNTPESRYVKSMTDGTDAVLSMRKMIKAFHDAEIAVNLDVVYNHTNGTGAGSIYDMTVPKYFYRLSADGGYANGSGCGNETATENVLVRKFVIDSLKHWMNDYHINGFRFDLMGLHETETMAEIYDALYEIDRNVLVYGEPWQSGGSPGQNLVTKAKIDECVSSVHKNDNGVACFNDTFRNAIKGSEYPNFSSGHVSYGFDDKSINEGLLGNAFTEKIGRSINYVECHDNNTLFDKLAGVALGGKSYMSGDLFTKLENSKNTSLGVVKNQDILSAAYMFLAQGMPFINGGQEFLRTKQGDENSYKSKDAINQIDITMKETYSDVYNYYKGLIALRKSSDAFLNAKSCTAETVKGSDGKTLTGITKYICEGESGDKFAVFFNATKDITAASSPFAGKRINVSSGKIEEGSAVENGQSFTLIGNSFVVIKATN